MSGNNLTKRMVLTNFHKKDFVFLRDNNISGVVRAFIDNIILYDTASNFEKKMSIIFKCVKDIEFEISQSKAVAFPLSNTKHWTLRLTDAQFKFIRKVYLHKEFSLFLNEIKNFVNSKDSNTRAYIICNLFDRYTSKPSIYYAIIDLRLINKEPELKEDDSIE